MSRKKPAQLQVILFIIGCVSIIWLVAWMCISGAKHLNWVNSFGLYLIGALIASISFTYYLAPKYRYSFIFAIVGAVLIFVLTYLIDAIINFVINGFQF